MYATNPSPKYQNLFTLMSLLMCRCAAPGITEIASQHVLTIIYLLCMRVHVCVCICVHTNAHTLFTWRTMPGWNKNSSKRKWKAIKEPIHLTFKKTQTLCLWQNQKPNKSQSYTPSHQSFSKELVKIILLRYAHIYFSSVTFNGKKLTCSL